MVMGGGLVLEWVAAAFSALPGGFLCSSNSEPVLRCQEGDGVSWKEQQWVGRGRGGLPGVVRECEPHH